MWISSRVLDFFRISKDSFDTLREDLAATRAERDTLKVQIAVSQNQFDWLRQRVNALEIERAALIKKAYGHEVAVPEIVRARPPLNMNALSDLFSDLGDEKAKELGYPVYETQ